MQPHLIRSSAESALALLEESERGTPQALLLAWVAWEGLKIRVLVVGLAMQGWRVADIYDVLSDERVHSVAHLRGLFREVFGSYPEGARGIAPTWKAVEEFRDLRNRYVHGTRGAAPMKLEAGTHLIVGCVRDPSWISVLSVSIDGVKTPLGDPYRRLPSFRGAYRSKSSLKELVTRARARR